LLAAPAVEGYLRSDICKFPKKAPALPEFAADLLATVKATLKTVSFSDFQLKFEDPISGKIMRWKTFSE
jgi:hypothetical protein